MDGLNFGVFGEKGCQRVKKRNELSEIHGNGLKKEKGLPGKEIPHFLGGFMWVYFRLLDLNNILNGFRDRRRLKFHTFCKLTGNLDNKGECPLEE